MSTRQARPAQGSKWGSFLSGAVANLESRLDKVFEEEGNPARATSRPRPDGRTSSPARAAAIQSEDTSRNSSPARVGSSRQGRQLPLNASGTTTAAARASSESRNTIANRTDSDSIARASVDSVGLEASNERDVATAGIEDGSQQEAAERQGNDVEPMTRTSLSIESQGSQRQSLEADRMVIPEDDHQDLPNGHAIPPLSMEDLQARLVQAQAERDAEALQRQEETHAYLERIDALQAKLEYLSKEAADSAREKAADAPADSLQKKLASKDEQIALLLEEGQKLSKAEVTHAGTARKLRAKIAEDGKILAEMRKRTAASEKSTSTLTDRVRRLEVAQRDASGKAARVPQLIKELQTARTAQDEQEQTIKYLRSQLDIESKRAEEAKVRADKAALEQQRKADQSMQEDLANAKIERQLSEERVKAELKAAKEEVSREQDNKKSAEAQMRTEITVLESRLESMRTRTEEASSGTGNDSQAKLMRQIETLQTQYSLASDNWQGIETSLQARLTAVEKERDDTARAETDSRRKLRESGNRSRRVNEQLDDVNRKASVLEQELSERQAHADRVEERAQEFERSLKEAKASFDREKQQWQTTLVNRIEEEKVKWRQEFSAYPGAEPSMTSIVESPPGSMRKPFELPGLGIGRRGMPGRQFSTELSIPSAADQRSNRKSITNLKSPRNFEASSPHLESGRSTPFLNGGALDAPSIHTQEPDDMFDNDSSPHRTVNDMISVSTANAGPSVQLVERMSAAVRRLESEKAATKDELSRLATQRDDARKEVVSMMVEIEEKRGLDKQIGKLQQDVKQVQDRYQTTLEMLGEKTERVEELQADVADLKKMYRELVETMR